MSGRLSDLSQAEIEGILGQIQKGKERVERECLWCGKAMMARDGQRFCCASCRAKYSQAAARIQYEKLCAEKELWLKEREELVREVQALRAQLAAPSR